jgi:tetratricopeptide (TPR) repeat protein
MMMPVIRLFKRSIQIATIAGAAIVATPPAIAACNEPALAVADEQDPAAAYLEAQAALRAEQGDRARELFAQVQGSGDETWQTIGRSGTALLDGDVDGARAAAQQAVERNADSPWTQYQLGVVANRQNDWPTAAAAFERATQLNGDLAYAHYHAGLAFQKQRQSAKASEHLQMFLKLAPDAPERAGVLAIIRTLG